MLSVLLQSDTDLASTFDLTATEVRQVKLATSFSFAKQREYNERMSSGAAKHHDHLHHRLLQDQTPYLVPELATASNNAGRNPMAPSMMLPYSVSVAAASSAASMSSAPVSAVASSSARRAVPASEVETAVGQVAALVTSVDLSSVTYQSIAELKKLLKNDAFRAFCAASSDAENPPASLLQVGVPFGGGGCGVGCADADLGEFDDHDDDGDADVRRMFDGELEVKKERRPPEQGGHDDAVEEHNADKSCAAHSVSNRDAALVVECGGGDNGSYHHHRQQQQQGRGSDSSSSVSSSFAAGITQAPPAQQQQQQQSTTATPVVMNRQSSGVIFASSTLLPTALTELNQILNGGVPIGNIVDIVAGKLDDAEYDAPSAAILALNMMTAASTPPPPSSPMAAVVVSSTTPAAAYVLSCSRHATVLFSRAAAEYQQQHPPGRLPHLMFEPLYYARRSAAGSGSGILDALAGVESRIVLNAPVRYLVVLDLDTATAEDSAAFSTTSNKFDAYTDRVLTHLKAVAQRQRLVVIICRTRDASDPVDDSGDGSATDAVGTSSSSSFAKQRRPRASGAAAAANVASYHAVNCRIRCCRPAGGHQVIDPKTTTIHSPSSSRATSPSNTNRHHHHRTVAPRPVGIEITKSAWCSTCATNIML